MSAITDWIQATSAAGAAIGLVWTLKLQAKSNLIQQLNLDRQFLPKIDYQAVGGSCKENGVRQVQLQIEVVDNPIFNFCLGANNPLGIDNDLSNTVRHIIYPDDPILITVLVPDNGLEGTAIFKNFAGSKYSQPWHIGQYDDGASDGSIYNYIRSASPINSKWKKQFKVDRK